MNGNHKDTADGSKARLLDDSDDEEAQIIADDPLANREKDYGENNQGTLSEYVRERWISLGVAAALVVLLLVLSVVFRSKLEGLPWLPHVPAYPNGHPIEQLIKDADVEFNRRLFRGSAKPGLVEAAANYRLTRHRHPPPGFAEWAAWGAENNCTMYEWMFDQVYEDLEPFWGLPAAKIRADAETWPVLISLRNGKQTTRRAMPAQWNDRDFLWGQMLSKIPARLPDMDLPINLDDNGHVFVPWEDMRDLIKAAAATRHLAPAANMSENSTPLPPPPKEATFEYFEDYPTDLNIWETTRGTCPPGSEARAVAQDADFTTPSRFPQKPLAYMKGGYIANWTLAKSACENPAIRNLHGYFINAMPGSRMLWKEGTNPFDRLHSKKLFPVFSSCKLQGSNNDILIPPATSFSDDYTADDALEWADKMDGTYWRGGASGGINNETNWTRFHRHRLVSMLNGTQVSMAEAAAAAGKPVPATVPGSDPPLPYNIPLPDRHTYPLGVYAGAKDGLGAWIASFADAAFNVLGCFPFDWVKTNNGTTCVYSSPFYASLPRTDMADMYSRKYLPDVDGHGYSGRFRAFVASNSVPVKATLWAEWTASRLQAWTHFVPMDNTFVDWYGLMDYFLGYSAPEAGPNAKPVRPAHDARAKAIADQGREWSRAVLRREDMVLYLWRVLLEYGRVCDDARERLGYVADLAGLKE